MVKRVFSFNAGENSIDVEQPDIDFENWTIVQEESISYDKPQFILDEWNKEFPDNQIDSYEKLVAVASRSKAMTLWLIDSNAKYSDYTQLPLFLENLISPKEYVALTTDIIEVNKVVADYSIKRQNLAKDYQQKLRKNESEEKETLDKIKSKSKLLQIMTLKQELLPLTLQMAIENYVPSDQTIMQESRRVYAREILIKFKKALVQELIKNPKLDVNNVIKMNELK